MHLNGAVYLVTAGILRYRRGVVEFLVADASKAAFRIHRLSLAILFAVHVAHGQLLDLLLFTDGIFTATFLSCFLHHTVRWRWIEVRWTFDVCAFNFPTGTPTGSQAVNVIGDLIPILEGFASIIALCVVLLLQLITVVFNGAALFFVIFCVFGGLATDLTIMLWHSTLGDVTFRRGEGN